MPKYNRIWLDVHSCTIDIINKVFSTLQKNLYLIVYPIKLLLLLLLLSELALCSTKWLLTKTFTILLYSPSAILYYYSESLNNFLTYCCKVFNTSQAVCDHVQFHNTTQYKTKHSRLCITVSRGCWMKITSFFLQLFSEIIHALRIKSRQPVSLPLKTHHPISANGVSAAGATGMMVGHPRFQEHTGRTVSNGEHLWALGRVDLNQRMPGATGPQCTATKSESKAKSTQTLVWLTKLSQREDVGQRSFTDRVIRKWLEL